MLVPVKVWGRTDDAPVDVAFIVEDCSAAGSSTDEVYFLADRSMVVFTGGCNALSEEVEIDF